MDYKSELNQIDQEIKNRSIEKARTETKLEELKKNKEIILEELLKCGVKKEDISKLPDIISNLEKEVEAEIERIKKEIGE